MIHFDDVHLLVGIKYMKGEGGSSSGNVESYKRLRLVHKKHKSFWEEIKFRLRWEKLQKYLTRCSRSILALR